MMVTRRRDTHRPHFICSSLNVNMSCDQLAVFTSYFKSLGDNHKHALVCPQIQIWGSPNSTKWQSMRYWCGPNTCNYFRNFWGWPDILRIYGIHQKTHIQDTHIGGEGGGGSSWMSSYLIRETAFTAIYSDQIHRHVIFNAVRKCEVPSSCIIMTTLELKLRIIWLKLTV